ncbi:hypothetical protein JW933_08300 [candidate division FCPU426 bacterium]|nr:hypothetical protein [candidate division FCPU426 bacterium]
MLNPGFRLLDPEAEQLERLAGLAADHEPEDAWRAAICRLEAGVRDGILHKTVMRFLSPGVHAAADINRCLAENARAAGVLLPPLTYFGWPESVWEKIISRYPGPQTLLLGILDAEGIWAGAIAGVQDKSLDFLTTFRTLWNDEPELASRQSLGDCIDICQAVRRKFGRPVSGLFMYRNEFVEWRDANWSAECLRRCQEGHTAVWHEW